MDSAEYIARKQRLVDELGTIRPTMTALVKGQEFLESLAPCGCSDGFFAARLHAKGEPLPIRLVVHVVLENSRDREPLRLAQLLGQATALSVPMGIFPLGRRKPPMSICPAKTPPPEKLLVINNVRLPNGSFHPMNRGNRGRQLGFCDKVARSPQSPRTEASSCVSRITFGVPVLDVNLGA